MVVGIGECGCDVSVVYRRERGARVRQRETGERGQQHRRRRLVIIHHHRHHSSKAFFGLGSPPKKEKRGEEEETQMYFLCVCACV